MTQHQQWHSAAYARHGRFVSDLGEPVVALLAPVAGERILDLGCGDGVLSAHIAARGCEVVAVDSSPSMVAAARKNGIKALEGSGTQLGFDREFDAVFSNAALHWMRPPAAVIDGVWRGLRPGGRFVGEFGGHGNIDVVVRALRDAMARRGLPDPDPWYFPTPAEYRALLESRGFLVESAEAHARPTPLPSGLDVWVETFANVYLRQVPVAGRSAFLSEVAASATPVLRHADGTWIADYVRLRFLARKPRGEVGPECA